MRTASRPMLRRLLELDRMIRSGAYPNANTAARVMEVTARTVHRDIDFLRCSWKAPLRFDPVRNGYFYTQPDFALPMLRVSEGEIIAVFLAERLLQQYRGRPFAAELAAVFEKLTSALPDAVSLNLDHLRDSYSVRSAPVTAHEAAVFASLARAVSDRRQLELMYWAASRDEITHRRVDPYHLTVISGEWYLIAFCHLREAMRMFAPNRIKSMRETGATFERPADFLVSDYLDASFGAMRGDEKVQTVRLRFEANAARYIQEKQWHPSQKLKPLTGGRVELTLRLNHLLEIRRWVLSWGSECEVLAPAELRTEIRAALRKMAAQYGD